MDRSKSTRASSKHSIRERVKPRFLNASCRLELLVLKPSRDLGKLSADLGGHLPRTLRILLRGLGSNRLTSPDFLSYLLFERPYVERLMQLGYDDGIAQWDEVERFLAGDRRA